MDFINFTKISSITAHLFDLFCQNRSKICQKEINTLTYKLAKFLVPTLKSLTSNEYMVKDSFAFPEATVKQDSGFFMGNLDVIFFSNCLNTLFENMEKVGLSKIEFKKLLSLAIK